MMQHEHAQQPLSVPPGFRFHPTDEELLSYYLKKKVSYEAFDLDVIKEVDLNKLEPWDLKDKCKIGSGPQDEWYFFSHKDKKYPTGTRTNRATTAGFWKATGRDKSIHLSNGGASRRIGMRKTLVFYTGRAPHGQKTDWIMHEYRLEDEHGFASDLQEDGWVVCRVFKKKNQKGYQAEAAEEPDQYMYHAKAGGVSTKNHLESMIPSNYGLDCSMHLPQLFSPEIANTSAFPTGSFIGTLNMDIECSQNLLRLTSAGSCGFSNLQDRIGNDWSFLDKLLSSSSSHHCLDQQTQSRCYNSYGPGFHTANDINGTSSQTKIGLFQYLGGRNVQTSQDNTGENLADARIVL
ncbi:hypothetical protein MLD38_021292 [Melastoma candidum]|uniref:Uncharacterized protein n=1 Tax=Melastoma candidum TaxID=119954 RepID=A0ACB9QEW2_9MYRT|nr:hypothetical protein MLD38_021292 [Melastoma candidum]